MYTYVHLGRYSQPIYMYTYIPIYIHPYIYTYIYIYVHLGRYPQPLYIHIPIYIPMYYYLYTYTYIYAHVCSRAASPARAGGVETYTTDSRTLSIEAYSLVHVCTHIRMYERRRTHSYMSVVCTRDAVSRLHGRVSLVQTRTDTCTHKHTHAQTQHAQTYARTNPCTHRHTHARRYHTQADKGQSIVHRMI
jgi:hypothetical protein